MKKLGRRSVPDAMRKKRQIAIRLLDSQVEALETISEREGLSVAYFVREAIEIVIRKYSKPTKGGNQHGSQS